MTRSSSALRVKGLLNIAKVLALLVWEVRRFDGKQIKNMHPARSVHGSAAAKCAVATDF